MADPQRVLAVCQGGHVRSVTLRYLLNYKYGGDCLACGWEPNTDDTKRMLYEWADVIVCMEESFLEMLPDYARAKACVLDVGPDVWGLSLHPDLIERIDGLLHEQYERQQLSAEMPDAEREPAA